MSPGADRGREHLEVAMRRQKRELAERIKANRGLLSCRVAIFDPHVHSSYSDGRDDVHTMRRWARLAGIDFIAVADHDTTRHWEACAQYDDVLPAEEVTTEPYGHHVVLIGVRRGLPRGTAIGEAWRLAREDGGLMIVAHPCGWFLHPSPPRAREALIESRLAEFIEIANGADNGPEEYFDETDADAIRLWDAALSAGIRSIGLGGSDAHHRYELGRVWCGVYDAKDREELIKRVREGRLFVSNGPFIRVDAEERGHAVSITARCVDRLGVVLVRVIADGRLVHAEVPEAPARVVEVELKLAGVERYIRVECYAVDGKRAYANPVFVGCQR